jgi:hypothetical protein
MRGELGYRCQYIPAGSMEKDVSRVIRLFYDNDLDFFVTLPRDQLPPDGSRFNYVSRALALWFASSPDFERTTPENDPLVIYKRRR